MSSVEWKNNVRIETEPKRTLEETLATVVARSHPAAMSKNLQDQLENYMESNYEQITKK